MTNQLSSQAKTANILPHLQSASLISLGQLCDDDCTVILDKYSLTATKNGQVVLTGTRNPQDGLWDVSLTTFNSNSTKSNTTNTSPKTPIERANIIIRKNQTTKELATYLHATCGSPAISTLLNAIKEGILQSWPGIELIKESDINPSIATTKGHLDQERKNLQSTRTLQPTQAQSTTASPSSPTPPAMKPPAPEELPIGPRNQSHKCFSLIQTFAKKAYSDLAGRYPHISSRGIQYIIVYDSSSILFTPLKNCTTGEISKAWTSIHDCLAKHGNAPKLYILDNEVSFEFKAALQKQQIAF